MDILKTIQVNGVDYSIQPIANANEIGMVRPLYGLVIDTTGGLSVQVGTGLAVVGTTVKLLLGTDQRIENITSSGTKAAPITMGSGFFSISSSFSQQSLCVLLGSGLAMGDFGEINIKLGSGLVFAGDGTIMVD